MSAQISSAERKSQIMANFDRIAAQYDGIRFVQICARRLIELSEIPLGARVLDVGTGTGMVALAVGEIVGPMGRVLGVDFSPVMLNAARQKLADTKMEQVQFLQGDAERLDLPDQAFDAVLFASSLFFVPDMSAALREAFRLLVPGGYVGLTGFGKTLFHPLMQLWIERLSMHQITMMRPPTERLEDPEICRKLLEEAGFSNVNVRAEQMGYYVSAPEQRWQDISAGLEGLPLKKIPADLAQQIRAEHLAELEKYVTPQGLWIDVPVNFAFGWKGNSSPLISA